MCCENTGAPHDRPLNARDLPIISRYAGNLSADFIQRVYKAMTDYCAVKPAALVTVLVLASQWFHRRYSVGTPRVVRLPFSVMDFTIFNRYQTPVMDVVHHAMLSFQLAERNVGLLNEVLKTSGIQYRTFCDCGSCIAPTEVDITHGEWYQNLNFFRSYGEAVGTPVVRIAGPEDVAHLQTDMGPYEWDTYRRIEQILNALPARETGNPPEDVLRAARFVQAKLVEPASVAVLA